MKNESTYSDERILTACEGVITRKGFIIEERGWNPLFDFIAYEDDEKTTLVFISCSAHEGTETEEEPFERKEVERQMFDYLMTNDPEASVLRIRFDSLSMYTAEHGRALVRYHMGCLN